jgi:hypothetical protein
MERHIVDRSRWPVWVESSDRRRLCHLNVLHGHRS